MQPPLFWARPAMSPGLAARLLSPLAWVVARLAARRLARGEWLKVGAPVICVGNINIGGTGKTPAVIALAARLKALGRNPAVVSRGYGGRLAGPVQVRERQHKAADVGDEPLLIAAFCETWVAKDRAAGARAAVAAGADVILLDDGFQNPGLHKDVSIVVVDAVAGFGNGRVFPAGGLREAPGVGLARADAVLLIGPERARRACLEAWPMLASRPLIEAELQPLETGMDWTSGRFLAFAGIGRPEKFFATLRGLGADLFRCEALSDHQELTAPLLRRLETDAFFNGAQLVTTEKDAVRLPEDFRLKVITLPVRLQIADWTALEAVLAEAGVSA
ncbi:MAG: tetraacyldisaccharide 4'-kinase [Rhodobacteraceae bacterium]|nr:tetraacyldisaccharide 4'-kinase [Paracoccaceae bacterium]